MAMKDSEQTVPYVLSDQGIFLAGAKCTENESSAGPDLSMRTSKQSRHSLESDMKACTPDRQAYIYAVAFIASLFPFGIYIIFSLFQVHWGLTIIMEWHLRASISNVRPLIAKGCNVLITEGVDNWKVVTH